jgi:hypothetical protein
MQEEGERDEEKPSYVCVGRVGDGRNADVQKGWVQRQGKKEHKNQRKKQDSIK